jgi:uncharacterized protein YciI
MWYLVLSRTLRSDEERDARTQPHLDWLDDLHRNGRALFSGRTADGAYGIYVLLCDSLDEARALAAEDPYHQHGDREAQVIDWTPRRAFRLDSLTPTDLERVAREGRQLS